MIMVLGEKWLGLAVPGGYKHLAGSALSTPCHYTVLCSHLGKERGSTSTSLQNFRCGEEVRRQVLSLKVKS